MVLLVVAAMAGIAVPVFSGKMVEANETATKASLSEIRDAVMEYWKDTKHVTLDGIGTVATEAQRFQIDWLFANPVSDDTTVDFDSNTRIGWNGPYIAESTGDIVALGGPALVDAWNQAIVLQDVNSSADLRDVRIVSGGPNGTVDIPSGTATSALTTANVGDDIYVAIELR